MITIISIIFHGYLNEVPADSPPPTSWLHHLPGSKNKNTGSPAPNAHIRTGYSKTYPSLTMGPAVPREHDCVWANVTELIKHQKKYIYIQENTQNRPGCFVIKSHFFLLTCLLILPTNQTDMIPRCKTSCFYTFMLLQLHYLKGPVGTFFVSTVERHQPTSRYNGTDSKLENASHMHNRNSFQL